MQILLVEDDHDLAKALQQALAKEGFVVNAVGSGEAAVYVIQNETPDMVILDIGLPDIDGLTVLKKIRPKHRSLPVLLLTARDTLDDKISGLDSGADDYMTKPFDIQELIARLKVIERRLTSVQSGKVTIGLVSLDINAHTVEVDGTALDLSKREYMLLKAMMETPKKIHSRENLEAQLYSWGEEVSSNTVEVHIHHLRKKLGIDFIKTIRGIGYTIKQ